MLNDRIMSVFDAAMKYLSAGEFVVVPKSDVRNALGEGFSQNEIDAAFNTLQMNELLQIRYADSDVYCLTVLPKGIREDERREEIREEERKKAALAAAEEERRAALAAAEETAAETADGVSEEKAEKHEERKPEIAAKPFSLVKAAIICGLSAFFGAFIAGMITLAAVISKLG